MEEQRKGDTSQEAEITVNVTESEEIASGEATKAHASGVDQNEGSSSGAWIPPFRRAGRVSSSAEIESVTTYTRNQQKNRHFLLQRFDDRWGPSEKKEAPPPEHRRLEASVRMEQRFRHVSIGGDGGGKDGSTLCGSKRPRFPSRPSLGNMGIQCVVKVNHFLAHVQTHNVLHHYDVSITPGVSSHTTNRAVMDELLKLYQEAYFGMRLPVYDGRKSLYTVSPLPFISKDFKVVISLEDEDSKGHRKEKEFKVAIKLVARSNLNELKLFLEGTRVDCPQDTLQILDVVLRAFPTTRFTRVGPSFYSPHLGKRQRLGGSLESWRGFYQSIRPTQMGLSLNIDISSSSFLEALPIPEFISQILNRDISSRAFTNAEFTKLRKSLKGVKVEVMHRGKMRRKYRISSLTTETAAELTFPDNDTKRLKSVVEHFKIAYGYDIEHPEWPCLKVGNPQRPSVLPMEVCKVVDGQKYSKKLDERQINNLLKMACQPPQQREKDISSVVSYNDYHNDPYCKEFGINIYDTLTSIEARVLPTPRLKFNDSGKERDCLPYIGQWNMKNKKMADGGIVNNWICINFSINVQETVVKEFCNELAMMCNISGMSFNTEPVLPVITSSPSQAERVLKAQYHDTVVKLQPLHQELDLIIFILPEYNGPLYGDIKRICDIDLGLVSQCCLSKHVFKMAKQYLANLALKINAKLGGRNTVLVDALSKGLPLIGDQPTIIFGADVNHPHPGEDISPSIAAVVGSQDWPEITKYAGLVSNQTHRQELIEDMFTTWEDPVKGAQFGGMIRELLTSFQKSTGHKPQRVIFYRDGVSEGQFYQVLTHEIEAIRKACASLEPDYQPPITFIVVQKRHHTRIFPNNHHDFSSVDRSGNILPGTVVDSKICHPTEFDFYLCSHAGIQGTSRPTHYHVLWDENNFTADQLQSLTYNLCYTYARCTRSVSIAPPAYYAHLAAARARWYGERETGTTMTKTGRPMVSNVTISGTQALESGPKTRPLPNLSDSAKRFMFY